MSHAYIIIDSILEDMKRGQLSLHTVLEETVALLEERVREEEVERFVNALLHNREWKIWAEKKETLVAWKFEKTNFLSRIAKNKYRLNIDQEESAARLIRTYAEEKTWLSKSVDTLLLYLARREQSPWDEDIQKDISLFLMNDSDYSPEEDMSIDNRLSIELEKKVFLRPEQPEFFRSKEELKSASTSSFKEYLSCIFSLFAYKIETGAWKALNVEKVMDFFLLSAVHDLSQRWQKSIPFRDYRETVARETKRETYVLLVAKYLNTLQPILHNIINKLRVQYASKEQEQRARQRAEFLQQDFDDYDDVYKALS